MATDIDFVDGFSHYITADLAAKWTQVVNATIVAGAGTHGNDILRMSSGADYVRKTFAVPSATHVVGVGINPAAFKPFPIFTFQDAGVTQCWLLMNVDGSMSWYRGENTVLLATGGVLVAGVRNYVEAKVTIGNAVGANTCEVFVNGVIVPALTLAAGADTQATANAYANSVVLGPKIGGGFSTTWDFEDFYHGSGTDEAGDLNIETLQMTANGNYAQWTPSAGTNWQNIDEIPPNTADYNETNVVNEIDTFVCQDVPAGSQIITVAVNCYAQKTSAGLRTIGGVIRSNVTDGVASAQALSLEWQNYQFEFPLNPDGNVAWTEAAVNAMEPGYKLIA